MKILYTSGLVDIREGGSTAKTHFIELAQNLARLGHKLLVLSPGRFPPSEEVRSKSILTVPVRYVSYLLVEILRPFYLAFFLLVSRPDVVYARKDVLDSDPPIVAWLFRVPYVVEVNGVIGESKIGGGCGPIALLVRLVERINYRLAHRVVCVTGGIKKALSERYGVDEGKLVVIPNGANTDVFKPMDKKECRRKLGLDEDAFYVGFAGSFAPWQGLEVLIEAARCVKEQGEPIKYLLVGTGSVETLLREKIKEYGLGDEVQFAGRVAYDEVVFYMSSFDVAVAPFTRERNALIGLSPLKLYEYLACGRAVIASRVDGVAEVIEEADCGYLFEPDNAQELADRILQTHKERDSIDEMGKRGRKLVTENYSWRETAEKVSRVLEEVIA